MSFVERPWIRRSILIGAGLVLLGLTVLPALNLFSKTNTFRDRDVGAAATARAELAEYERLDLPDDLNAARWLEAGAAAVVWTEDQRRTVGRVSALPYPAWSIADRAAVREIVLDQAGALAILHRAAPLESSSFGIHYQDGLQASIPSLLDLLHAGRLLMAEARIAFADGDEGRGLEALATAYRLAEAQQQESTLITALVGIAAERMAAVVACEVVASAQPFVSQPGFLEHLTKVSAERFDHPATIRRVAAAWEAAVRLAHAEGDHGNESAGAADSEIPADLDLEQLARAAEKVAELAEVPFGSARDRFEALTTMLGPTDAGLGVDLKGFARVIGRAQSVDAQRQLLRAAVAVRRLGLERGDYPVERPAIPELTQPDPFAAQLLTYAVDDQGVATLDVAGVRELLSDLVVPSAVASVRPVVLPAP